MIQIVLQDKEGNIIESAKAKNQAEVLNVLTDWLEAYNFLDKDKITFYRF